MQPKGVKPPQKKEPKVTPAPIPKVKPEEAEIMPQPEKPESSTAKKQSEILRQELAENVEWLHSHVEDIRKDFKSYSIKQQLEIMLERTERLIEAETIEENERYEAEDDQ